ncbi:hypothetical protein SDC9_115651 [bioreactor metagenome]|uniref:Uncharacterized protein n=1 Tax=bioreactor metagenome TaxID=1076179 RepID=A0A645BU39_9ZZZZ
MHHCRVQDQFVGHGPGQQVAAVALIGISLRDGAQLLKHHPGQFAHILAHQRGAEEDAAGLFTAHSCLTAALVFQPPAGGLFQVLGLAGQHVIALLQLLGAVFAPAQVLHLHAGVGGVGGDRHLDRANLAFQVRHLLAQLVERSVHPHAKARGQRHRRCNQLVENPFSHGVPPII